MPTCYIMVGLPGTGKSTLVNMMTETIPKAFVYSTDAYIEQCSLQNGMTYDQGFSEFIDPATKHMNEQVAIAIRSKQTVIWDQTNTGVKKRKTIVNRFDSDWTFKCICILPPQGDSQIEDWHFRLNNRPGKTIPDHIIKNMRTHFAVPTLDERFDEVVYYNMYGEEISDVE